MRNVMPAAGRGGPASGRILEACLANARRMVIATALGTALWGALAARVGAERVLFDFGEGFDVASVAAQDVRVSRVRSGDGFALRIASGHNHPWPGITLRAPDGRWDLSPYDYLSLQVRNAGKNAVTVTCRVDNPGADGVRNCNVEQIALKPGQAGTLRVVFERKDPRAYGIRLFGMRGYPFPQDSERAIDPANVNQVILFVPQPKEDHLFEIADIRAGGAYTAPPLPDPKTFFPFIDAFGQYLHRDWPGKTHSLEDLPRRLKVEQEELRARPGPPGWNQYGGWQDGPTLKATGFFRTEKHQGKWWLVDPAGKLFFSHGPNCVRAEDYTPVDDRDGWFQDFPGDQPQFQGFFAIHGRVVRGYYLGRQPRSFNFAAANARRKYGEKWRDGFGGMAHRRLQSWGMNSIANWSDEAIYLMRRTPYTATIYFAGKALEGSEGYWGPFRDVFDPSFRADLRKRLAQEAGKSAGDPWCIGYFVDNELSWGDEVSLAVAALVSPPDQIAKQVFVADLKAKYGAIEKLNQAWGAEHASWEALLQHRQAPDRKRAWEDLTAFYTKTAEHYFRTIKESIREAAPNQLYLGCRFAWVNARAAEAAAKHCDVVSYNLYRRSVADFRPPFEADVPLIIGEFHFGALDRGLFHTGLVRTGSQEERAQAYKEYVEGVLRHPLFVGCHWFKYQDQPATGRALDEENYQIGLVDIVDTPYPEIIAASRDVGYGMYRYRLAKGETP